MAMLEAMALGRPVIATAVGSVPEVIVDGRTGRLVPPANRDALGSALHALLSSKPLRLRLGAAAREVVSQRFNAALTASAYENLYRLALRRSKA
jgi:glycosyltransferase involved in cell wall biosynthesis